MDLEEDVSAFGLKDGKISSCLLFGREQDGVIQNLFMYNRDTDLSSSEKLFHLISFCATQALLKYPDDTRVSIYTGNKTARKIVNEIFPNAKPKHARMEFELLFADAFADTSKRFTDDISFEPIENDRLVCARCRHCTNSVISCGMYLQKPDGVLGGSECKLFETV